MHLDGARIHLASVFTGTPVEEYSKYFDTVYISLYKYLNATGGAILCGDTTIIDQVSHQIKIYGGTVFQSWPNTAVALHYLEGINERLLEVSIKANQLIKELNNFDEVKISKLTNGTNIHFLNLSSKVSLKKLANYLHEEHQISLGRANEKGIVNFAINESLLNQDVKEIIAAWGTGIRKAKN